MQKENIVIIGAGIVGCNISYFLKENNIKHILLEKSSELFNNASGCAGAFITPTLGRVSDIKNLLDNAFIFAKDFYTSLNKNIIEQGTVLLVDEYNKEFEKNIPHRYKKVSSYGRKGYLFLDAMSINPLLLAQELIRDKNIIYDYFVKTIEHKDKKYIINNDIVANKIILASGYDVSLINEPYIDTRMVYGRRIDISTSTEIPTAVNKEIYFSKSINNKISIGATHHRITNQEDIQHISQTKDIDYLLENIQNITTIKDINIESVKGGIRACSKDYFPIVGNIIDSKKTILKFPSIKHGKKIAFKDMIIKDNIFICSGVGGRGFTLAPYISNILIEHILKKTSICNNMNLYKRFIRYCRKLQY